MHQMNDTAIPVLIISDYVIDNKPQLVSYKCRLIVPFILKKTLLVLIASYNDGITFWTPILVVMSNERIINICVKRFS